MIVPSYRALGGVFLWEKSTLLLLVYVQHEPLSNSSVGRLSIFSIRARDISFVHGISPAKHLDVIFVVWLLRTWYRESFDRRARHA